MRRTEDYSTREATPDDVIDIAILGKQFVRESGNYELFGWNASKVTSTIIDAIHREDFGVFVFCHKDEIVGLFVCFATPCFFSDNVQAVEILWYVDPEHRGSRKSHEMVDIYVEWAKTKNAVAANLVNLELLKGEKVAKLYNRKGFNLVENTFLKEL